MLEFTNGKDVTRTLCADCVTGIVTAMELPPESWGRYVAAYVAAVTSMAVSVVSDDAGS